MAEPITFKIIVPHADLGDDRYHSWFFPNGWRGVGPMEHRDRAGRARRKRAGYLPEWFVLMCNNPGCPARAAVPVYVLTNHADAVDPQATR